MLKNKDSLFFLLLDLTTTSKRSNSDPNPQGDYQPLHRDSREEQERGILGLAEDESQEFRRLDSS